MPLHSGLTASLVLPLHQQGIVNLKGDRKTWALEIQTLNSRGYRFPPGVITYVVWVYHRFCLSFRDVEETLAERGVSVSYEGVRQW